MDSKANKVDEEDEKRSGQDAAALNENVFEHCDELEHKCIDKR